MTPRPTDPIGSSSACPLQPTTKRSAVGAAAAGAPMGSARTVRTSILGSRHVGKGGSDALRDSTCSTSMLAPREVATSFAYAKAACDDGDPSKATTTRGRLVSQSPRGVSGTATTVQAA